MYQGKQWFLKGLLSILIIFMFMGWVNQAQCQEKYPTRAIDIIVPFAPGGGSDLLARFIAEALKKKWGVVVNVINKAGGNTVPANLEVYQAKPDGYTMFSDSQSSCSLLEAAIKDLPFKVLDRTFIAFTTASPHVLYVNSKSPFKNLKDVEAEFKRDPENSTWGSFGGVGAADYMMRQFFKAIGVDVSKTKPVICRGGAESASLTAGGHIKFGPASAASGLPHVRAGTLRVVAVTRFRIPDFPDVPTAAEQGYPAVNAVFWAGVSGPPKLPSHIINKWEEALQEVVKDQEFVSKLKNIGFAPFYLNSSEAREHVVKEMEEAVKLWGLK